MFSIFLKKPRQTPFYFSFTVALLFFLQGIDGKQAGSQIKSLSNKVKINTTEHQIEAFIPYDSLLVRINAKKVDLSEQYQNADDSQDQSKVIAQSRDYIKQVIIDSMFEAWAGTPYDYSGMTEVPGQGGIACGYFITTVLKHAGFDVERNALAQKKSLYIAQTLSDEIERYPNSGTGEFLRAIEEKPNGLYLLGLDQHVAFLVIRDSAIKTCHAAYYPPLEVVQEKAGQSQAIQSSSYKVIARLLTDDLMRKWLTQSPIETVD